MTKDDLISRQPETHEERTETHACDCISRKAAIDAVYKCADIFAGDMPVMVVKSDAYEALAQLPPAQPEVLACGEGELMAQQEPHWIPCSERLPDSKGYVLVTDYGETNIGRRFCGRWWLDYCGDKMKDVTAWMPLPEPYKGGARMAEYIVKETAYPLVTRQEIVGET